MFQEVGNEFRAYAMRKYPEEACAVVAEGKLLTLENLAEDPEHTFEIDKKFTAQLQIEGKLEAVLHSHPNGNLWPSKRDMTQQLQTAVPWGICTVGALGETANNTSEILWWGDQVPMRPLIGRPFIHGVCDCYSLGRDLYRAKLDIELPVHPRDFEWWEHGEDLLEQGFREAGFFEVPLKQARPGDAFLGKVLGKVSNHCGVYLGDSLMLHHLYGRASRREPITPWLRHLVKVLRHNDLKNVTLPTLKIEG